MVKITTPFIQKLNDIGHEVGVANYKLRISNYELRVKDYMFRVISVFGKPLFWNML